MFNPALYVKQNSLQKRDVGLVLQDVIHRMQWNQEENVLDVGCGPGDVTTSVLSHYLPDDVKIVGCDISDNMIRYAQATYESKRFSFKQLDVGNSNIWMNWDEGSYDKIFSFYCLHWVKDLRPSPGLQSFKERQYKYQQLVAVCHKKLDETILVDVSLNGRAIVPKLVTSGIIQSCGLL